MKPRTALAILTYVDAARPAAVGQRLPDAIASLEHTSYRDPVFVVDDGSTGSDHLKYLASLDSARFTVVRRPANGGISRAKNTCLRILAQTGAEILFLAEDDILFREGWEDAYGEAMRRSAIQHFSWYESAPGNVVMACNGTLVTMTAGLLGLLMTFTQEAVRRVGGFKVLPHRYGFEHINWTYRAIQAGLAPFGADIVESFRYIRRSDRPSSLDVSEILAGAEANRASGYEITRLCEPLQE